MTSLPFQPKGRGLIARNRPARKFGELLSAPEFDEGQLIVEATFYLAVHRTTNGQKFPTVGAHFPFDDPRSIPRGRNITSFSTARIIYNPDAKLLFFDSSIPSEDGSELTRCVFSGQDRSSGVEMEIHDGDVVRTIPGRDELLQTVPLLLDEDQDPRLVSHLADKAQTLGMPRGEFIAGIDQLRSDMFLYLLEHSNPTPNKGLPEL